MGRSRDRWTKTNATVAKRETHVCPRCQAESKGLLNAENHLVFAHSVAREAARELVAKAAGAGKLTVCTYCKRTDGTHTARCRAKG